MGGSASKEVWKDVYHRAESNMTEASKETNSLVQSGDLDPSDEAALNRFAKDKQAEFQAKNSEVFAKLWKLYDADEDGLLSQAECGKLVHDSMQEAKKYMPEIMSALLAGTLEPLRHMMDDEAVGAFDAMMKKVIELCTNRVRAILSQDSKPLASALWLRLDADEDGRVTRDDFMRHYSPASAALIETGPLAEQLKHELDALVDREIHRLRLG